VLQAIYNSKGGNMREILKSLSKDDLVEILTWIVNDLDMWKEKGSTPVQSYVAMHKESVLYQVEKALKRRSLHEDE
tara:strand:- start:1945 stop:2172 length:228 start_codon:yes stop_codon:yes gene_type:complete